MNQIIKKNDEINLENVRIKMLEQFEKEKE